MSKSKPYPGTQAVLRAIRLEELITHTLDDYVRLATRLGRAHGQLMALKHKLEQNKFQTPLFEMHCHTQYIENAYEQMWLRYRQGLPPQELTVKP